MKTWMHGIAVLTVSISLFADEGYPREFTDAAGHKVVLAAKPQRIASLTLGTDENLLSLVDPSRIVAMTAISKEPYVSNVADRVPEGMLLVKNEWEKVVEAKPDLVLVATYTKEFVQPLVDKGLPVYQFSEFKGLAALQKNLEILGQLTGEEAKAAEILEGHRKRLAQASQGERKVRAIYFSEGRLSGGKTTPSDILLAAGLIDVCAEFGVEGTLLATPKLIANLNPDVILIGEDSKEAEEGTMKLFQTPEYQAIPAVKAGRVFPIPGKHITTVSHHILEAVGDIERALGQ